MTLALRDTPERFFILETAKTVKPELEVRGILNPEVIALVAETMNPIGAHMKPATRQDYEERILRVLVHLQKHLDQAPGLEELAAIAHFSPFHFHRIFRGMVGESVQSHQRRLRLERAASRLNQTDDTVIRIALEAGFESHAAFTRAFKSMMGRSPSAWRESREQDLPALSPAHPEELFSSHNGGIAVDVKIVHEEEVRVAFVRHTGPYDQCGAAWEKLCGRLGAEGLLGNGPRFIGLSYDDPEVTPAHQIRYDACVEVDASYQPSGEIGVQVLPGGDFAQTTHFGPYENLKTTYAALMGRWLPDSGRRYRLDPTREVYLNDPDGTAPEDLVTDIFLPLEDTP